MPLGGSPQKRSNAESLVAKGLSRQVVKRKANYIIKMFDRGVALELIPLEYAMRLKTLGSIEMPIKPKRQVWGVDLKLVEATQAELTPVVADMVQLQLLIGARPSEVCNLRPCDIDRTGDVWIYIPAKHKTQHHGHSRRIVIGPKAQQVLARYLLRDPKAFCFTPIEAYEQHYQQRRENRKTPDSCGNGPKPRKQKNFRPCYDRNSYRRCILRATERAFPIPEAIENDAAAIDEWKERFYWRPNQLRKSAATTARKEFDLETAQLVLGHASLRRLSNRWLSTKRFWMSVAAPLYLATPFRLLSRSENESNPNWVWLRRQA